MARTKKALNLELRPKKWLEFESLVLNFEFRVYKWPDLRNFLVNFWA